jgi:ribosomal protein L37AE/L43A
MMNDIPANWEQHAYPGLPEARLIRAIYGLCPTCDHPPEAHEGDDYAIHKCSRCPEMIRRGVDGDDWIYCLCGNDPSGEGFAPCLEDGTIVEPTVDGPWKARLYLCERCGRIVDQVSLLVTGKSRLGGDSDVW